MTYNLQLNRINLHMLNGIIAVGRSRLLCVFVCAFSFGSSKCAYDLLVLAFQPFETYKSFMMEWACASQTDGLAIFSLHFFHFFFPSVFIHCVSSFIIRFGMKTKQWDRERKAFQSRPKC